MANEKRLIYANALKMALCTKEGSEALGHSIVKLARVSAIVDAQPTVDAVEVAHGRWEDVAETSLYVPDMKYTVTHTAETCSACKVRIGFIGSKPYLYDNICPNCGAIMDGGNEDGKVG